MATDASAEIITLHQPKAPKAPMTQAERARNYRLRKKAGAGPVAQKARSSDLVAVAPEQPRVMSTITPVRPVPALAVTPRVTHTVTPSRRSIASIVLTVAAVGLAIVGVCMNGSFAHGLGANAVSGSLFLAIGVAADLCALAVPSCAAGLWQAHQRGTAVAAWAIWALTFAFTITAGLGFASVNISDVTASRASRVTPAVTMAQTAYSDAMAARDRECKGGVGKFCRERETAVAERRQALDVAMRSVQQAADPQTDAAVKIVAWLTFGQLAPSGDDFAMVRLILLALFPQIGGLLLMVARRS